MKDQNQKLMYFGVRWLKDILLQTSQEKLDALCEGDPAKGFCIGDIKMEKQKLLELSRLFDMIVFQAKKKSQQMLIRRLQRMTSCETDHVAFCYAHIPFTVQALLLMCRLGLPLPVEVRLYPKGGDCLERIIECRRVAEYWKRKKLKRKQKKKLKRMKEVKRKKRCLQ